MKKLNFILLIIILLMSNSAFSQNCNAYFTYTIDNNNQTIQFTDSSYSADNSLTAQNWSWTINGTTFSNQQNPILQYDTSILVVCLYVEFNQNCSSSFCDTIYQLIYPIDSCVADFTYTLDTSTNTITFNSTSYTNGTICDYFWDFDDGTHSDLETPTHTFLSSGTYSICLHIYTSLDTCISIVCEDIYCETIYIPNIIIPDISISGNVYAKTALLPEGIAILNKVETNKHTAILYTHITNGSYMFNNLDTGNYTVYAIPYFGDIENYYPLYYPTYAGNTAHYNNALISYVDSAITQNISLLHNNDINHGFGYISGKVVYDEGSNFETNIFNQNWFSSVKSNYKGVAQNITILMYNNLGKVIDYSLTDENGDFEFKNVPLGFNLIYTEKAGKTTQSFPANLNQNKDTIQNILIHIQETEIINVENINKIETNIYPNPFKNFLNIEIDKSMQDLSISIVDITGKQVFYRNFDNIHLNILKIKTNLIKKGSYILLVKSGNSIIFRKKMIK